MRLEVLSLNLRHGSSHGRSESSPQGSFGSFGGFLVIGYEIPVTKTGLNGADCTDKKLL